MTDSLPPMPDNHAVAARHQLGYRRRNVFRCSTSTM